MIDNLIPLFIGLPMAGAFIIPVIAKKWRWTADATALIVMFALAALSVAVSGGTGLYKMGSWDFPLGIELRLDGLSSMMLLAINIIGLCMALFSVPYMRMYSSRMRFFALFLLLVTGVNGVVLTGDLFNLYIFMEIASIASYALVGFGCESDELEASFKYLVLGSVASAFIFLGIALLYMSTGVLNLAQLSERLASLHWNAPVYLAAILLFCGFGLKAAFIPFHAWLPDAHPSAPAPVSAMLSGIVIKVLGIYVLARLLFNVFGNHDLLIVLQWLGAASMLGGVLLAIGQWDMKRLFAYHSISQIGYIALGLGLGTPLGIVGALYHLVNHSVFKSLLFLNAGSVEYSTGTRDLKKLGGLSRTMPVTGATSLVASLSIAGVPPFNGFFSKLIIIIACVLNGSYLFAAVAAFVSLMTLASFLKVQKYGFFEHARMAADQIKRTPALMGAAMIILALLCVGMSFLVISGFSSPLIIGPAADVLTGGTTALR